LKPLYPLLFRKQLFPKQMIFNPCTRGICWPVWQMVRHCHLREKTMERE